jgi:excisionase family DNA binding protein
MSKVADLIAELRDDPAVLAELRELLGTGPAVYTPRTLAAELGITPRAVRAAIERGDLEARRSGRGYVIGAEAVSAWARSPSRRRPRRASRRGSRPLHDAMAGLGDGRATPERGVSPTPRSAARWQPSAPGDTLRAVTHPEGEEVS